MTKPTEIHEAEVRGATAERERIAAILKSPMAKGREGAALSLALESSCSAATAIDLLSQLKMETEVARANARHPVLGLELVPENEVASAAAPVGLTVEDDSPRAGGDQPLAPHEVARLVNENPEGRK